MQTETLWGVFCSLPNTSDRFKSTREGNTWLCLSGIPMCYGGLMDAVGGHPHFSDMGGAIKYVTRFRSPQVTSGLHP